MAVLWILNISGNLEAVELSTGLERILDTDSLPAEQTHAWLKTLVDSSGDHGMPAFLPWPGLRHHRARFGFLRISMLGSGR